MSSLLEMIMGDDLFAELEKRKRSQKRSLPFPEVVDDRDWEILDRPEKKGDVPGVDTSRAKMLVPSVVDPLSARIRAHELGHAALTPRVNLAEVARSNRVPGFAINVLEDARIQHEMMKEPALRAVLDHPEASLVDAEAELDLVARAKVIKATMPRKEARALGAMIRFATANSPEQRLGERLAKELGFGKLRARRYLRRVEGKTFDDVVEAAKELWREFAKEDAEPVKGPGELVPSPDGELVERPGEVAGPSAGTRKQPKPKPRPESKPEPKQSEAEKPQESKSEPKPEPPKAEQPKPKPKPPSAVKVREGMKQFPELFTPKPRWRKEYIGVELGSDGSAELTADSRATESQTILPGVPRRIIGSAIAVGQPGSMVVEEPKLTVRLPRPKPKLTRPKVARDDGGMPRQIFRAPIDGKVFRRRVRRVSRQRAGTLLIDASGSMAIGPEDIAEVVRLMPYGKVAIYWGRSKAGTLRVVAKNGRYAGDAALERDGYFNVIDVPALRWLSRQKAPRIWVSDGGVTGVTDRTATNISEECEKIIRQSNIWQVFSIDELLYEFSIVAAFGALSAPLKTCRVCDLANCAYESFGHARRIVRDMHRAGLIDGDRFADRKRRVEAALGDYSRIVLRQAEGR